MRSATSYSPIHLFSDNLFLIAPLPASRASSSAERAEAEAAIEGKTFDVVITSTPQDQELAVFLNSELGGWHSYSTGTSLCRELP